MTSIRELSKHEDGVTTLQGWVANKRTSKTLVFIVLRDGSGFAQCVVDLNTIGEDNFEKAKRLTQESSVTITGKVVKDERQIGGYEVQVTDFEIHQIAEEYPISNKEHGVDFLINNRHLWLRSKKQWAIMRIRNRLKYVIHTFFQERGFIQTDAPILTGNACEGTTELFETEFYKKDQAAFLSQSGQLYGEAAAFAHGKIYTFGPCFRAEKSVTPRHLSEFWMIEPEMAYYNIEMNMDLIEEFIKYIINDVHKTCETELQVLERDSVLFDNINKPFPRMTYDDAVSILKGEKEVDGRNALALMEGDLAQVKTDLAAKKEELAEKEGILAKGGIKKGKRNYLQSQVDKLKGEIKNLEEMERNIPKWIESARNFKRGEDLGAADERVLTRLYKTPIMVYKWPAAIKAFYMKRYEDDPDYVKGVDVLAPEGFGEVVGGAEREDDFDTLHKAIVHHELPMKEFEWYLDLRRYGSVPHAGFGLGFERTVMWLSGAKHIRETIPFPRYYGRLFP